MSKLNWFVMGMEFAETQSVFAILDFLENIVLGFTRIVWTIVLLFTMDYVEMTSAIVELDMKGLTAQEDQNARMIAI